MDKRKPTLAIYGIQDRDEYEHPFYVHDHNLCVMQNGRIREFLQLERISRRKRDNRLYESLPQILKDNKLLAEDFDLVFVDNVVGRTFLTTKGNVRFEAPLGTELHSGLEKGRCWWFGHEKEAWVLNHELAHIYSCLPFFGEFEPNSLLVHFDGGASLSNFSAWTYKKGNLEKYIAHWDYRYLTTIFNANALVFSVIGAKVKDQNSVPGKMMGLAGHGNYRQDIEEWLRENNFFENIWNRRSDFFKQVQADWNMDLKSFDQKNSFILDCIATLHEVFVKETVSIFENLQAQTQTENLYYTGGCALNIVANTRIIRKEIFKKVFIPPCTEDSGLAIGAAAFAELVKHGRIEHHSPYLNGWQLDEDNSHCYKDDIESIAKAITENKVIGICNGNGEAGPRALGNRSLVCLASSKALGRKVSMQHKKREWYRPVAPVMLEKNAIYFTGLLEIHLLSKYMLLDFDILPERQNELSGALHVDGTSRIQTIFEKSQNPFLWDLLTLLDEKYHIRALINTSFNSQGEPLVHTSDDALKSARKMGIDGIVVNGKFQLI